MTDKIKNSTDDANFYKEKLLDHLLEQHRKALCKLQETRFLDISHQGDVKKWYDDLVALICKSPPNQKVRCLHIFEDASGCISRILYEYDTERDGGIAISEIIHADIHIKKKF